MDLESTYFWSDFPSSSLLCSWDILSMHLLYSTFLPTEKDETGNSAQTRHIPASIHQLSHQWEVSSTSHSFLAVYTSTSCSFRSFISTCTFESYWLLLSQSFICHSCQNRKAWPYRFAKWVCFRLWCPYELLRDCASTVIPSLLIEQS